LQPVNISIPMTCTHRRHDMLFHVVYGDDRMVMMEFIHACAQRLYSLTNNTMLSETIFHVMNTPQSVSLAQSRALFFLLLNVDMPLKEYVCDTFNKELLAKALNIPLTDVASKQSYAMIGAHKADPPKLQSFFWKLSHEIVPNWMQNQGLTFSDLVETIREEYIIS
jgi:hypothetical protein